MRRERSGAVVAGGALVVCLLAVGAPAANADPFKGCQVVKGRWSDGKTVSVQDQAVIPPQMRYLKVGPEAWASVPGHIGDCSPVLF